MIVAFGSTFFMLSGAYYQGLLMNFDYIFSVCNQKVRYTLFSMVVLAPKLWLDSCRHVSLLASCILAIVGSYPQLDVHTNSTAHAIHEFLVINDVRRRCVLSKV